MLKLEHGQAIHQVKYVNQGPYLSSCQSDLLVIKLGQDFMVLNICRKFDKNWSKNVEVGAQTTNIAARRG